MYKFKVFGLIIGLGLLFAGAESASAAKLNVAVMQVESTVSVTSRLKDQVRSDIENWLVNSGKVDVVDRAKLESISSEILLSEDGLVNPDSAIQFGNFTGAGYLLYPKVVSAWSSSKREVIPFSGGEAEVKVNAGFKLHMKLINASTTKIIASQQVTGSYSTIRLESEGGIPSGAGALSSSIRKAMDKAGAVVINALYPVKVAHVSKSSGIVTLNAGKKRVKKGQVLKVYSQGEAIVDPDTGELLGAVEEVIGKIKITEVRDKLSKARVIDGRAEIKAICR
ncbi:MAG: CsgG/HfaB family protein [Sedimenticola sp.]